MRRTVWPALAGALTVAALLFAPGAYGLSPPIKIGSNHTSEPTQAAIAVGSSGTAYIAWQDPSGTQMNFCAVPTTASGCTPVALTVPAGGTLEDPPTVLLEGGGVFVFEEVGGATDDNQDGLVAWVSSNGGASFTQDPDAVADPPGPGEAYMAIALLNSNFGVGTQSAVNPLEFQANSLTSPANYSGATSPTPFATISPSPDTYSTDNLGASFASQLTGATGVLGVGSILDTGPCPSSEGLAYAYAPISASTSDAELNTSPGGVGSPWQPLAGVDCNSENPAVGGGPSGLGLLETNPDTLGAEQIAYRRFTPPRTFSPPVEIAPGVDGTPSLSQDGSGGIYATWVDNDTGLDLAFSSSGGTSWHWKTLLSNNGGATSIGSTASAVSASGQGWAAYAANGTEYAQPFSKTAVLPPPPVNTKRPKITGTAKAGKKLSCSRGTWTGTGPIAYTYQWNRNGVALAGSTRSTYTVRTLDEGTALTCTVTATNAGGSASATSKAVKVPIPFVAHCPGATGRVSGTTLGLVKVGMTRARAHYLYRFHSNRGKQYEDFFCLTPIGVRVGYASPKLLHLLSKLKRKQLEGKVVWASTSNPYYSLDGVRPGESIAAASKRLVTESPFHIGLNDWYLARKSTYTAVLKVRRGVVQEVGIADQALTVTRSDQNVLMHSFE